MHLNAGRLPSPQAHAENVLTLSYTTGDQEEVAPLAACVEQWLEGRHLAALYLYLRRVT